MLPMSQSQAAQVGRVGPPFCFRLRRLSTWRRKIDVCRIASAGFYPIALHWFGDEYFLQKNNSQRFGDRVY